MRYVFGGVILGLSFWMGTLGLAWVVVALAAVASGYLLGVYFS